MKSYYILGTGNYPGYSAGAKRINLYIKGLMALGVNCKYISTNNLLPRHIARYFGSLFLPYLLIYIISINVKRKDVIIFYLRGWFSIFFALLYCKLRGIKVVFEVNEKPYSFYYNTTFERIINKKVNAFLFNNFVIPLFDGFIVISQNLKNYIERYKRKEARIIKIPIIVDTKIYNDEIIDNNTKSENNYIVHIGGISDYKEGITDIIHALLKIITLNHRNIHLYLTENRGVDNELDEINKIIKSPELKQYFHFIGKQTEAELEKYIRKSTMAIIFKPDNEQNRFNFSTKLAEFLKYGIPVIYTPIGEVTNFLEDEVSGFLVNCGNVSDLTERIIYILDYPETARKVGLNGREVAELCFDYKHYSIPLNQFLEII